MSGDGRLQFDGPAAGRLVAAGDDQVRVVEGLRAETARVRQLSAEAVYGRGPAEDAFTERMELLLVACGDLLDAAGGLANAVGGATAGAARGWADAEDGASDAIGSVGSVAGSDLGGQGRH